MFCLSVTSEIILNSIVRLIDCLFRLITFFVSEEVELQSNSDMFIKIHICFPFMFLTFNFLWFLGGLSLHLNHLIASGMTIYDWPFRTLPFRLFGSNLDTRDLETYPRTYSDHFWNMSIFDDSRAI